MRATPATPAATSNKTRLSAPNDREAELRSITRLSRGGRSLFLLVSPRAHVALGSVGVGLAHDAGVRRRIQQAGSDVVYASWEVLRVIEAVLKSDAEGRRVALG
jgi:hypothetical protein